MLCHVSPIPRQSEAGRKLPFVFVLNLQIPGSPQYSLVCYFASDRPLREGSLLQRFADAKDDAYRNKRFKLIPRIEEVRIEYYT